VAAELLKRNLNGGPIEFYWIADEQAHETACPEDQVPAKNKVCWRFGAVPALFGP